MIFSWYCTEITVGNIIANLEQFNQKIFRLPLIYLIFVSETCLHMPYANVVDSDVGNLIVKVHKNIDIICERSVKFLNDIQMAHFQMLLNRRLYQLFI